MADETVRGKIAFAIFNLETGGAERVFVKLANSFASEGWKVEVVLFQHRGPMVESLAESIQVRDVGWGTVSLWESLRRVRALIAMGGFQRVVGFLPNVNLVIGLLAGRRLGEILFSERIAPEFYWRGKGWRKWAYRLYLHLLPSLYSRSLGLVVQTHRNRESWVRLGVAPEKIKVISNGFDGPEMLHRSAGADPFPSRGPISFRILSVARVTRQKCPWLAFKMIQKLPVEMGWFWVGGGDLLDAMRERVKIRHQESRLQFVGEQTNPFPWYKNGDLFVLTSAFEGFPNVLVEAMSFGMVPVAFDCPSGPAEIIEEGKSGFLIPLGRWVRMVDKIRQLQEDPKMRLAMGDEAIRRSRKFDQSAILKKWKQVIIR